MRFESAYRRKADQSFIAAMPGAMTKVVILAIFTCMALGGRAAAGGRNWRDVPPVALKGGLELFWNVYDRTIDNNNQAYSRGFSRIGLVDPYADRSGDGKERILTALASNKTNPWLKPPYFEKVIRADTSRIRDVGILVQDIEFSFEEDIVKAWNDPLARTASRSVTFEDFSSAYMKEWATWFTQPLIWSKQIFPNTRVGLYGPQPFRRDYWGIQGKDARQIDGTHASDHLLWQHIDPHVDFYISSIYMFYDLPDSVFYMASNVEENYVRTRSFGNRPLYAYSWMRFHDSNPAEGNRELPSYLVEAMALVPYFSGATGIVLWGYEPALKPEDGQPYEGLPLFVQSINRLASFSDKIARGRVDVREPAHVAWKNRRPLVRYIELGPRECLVLGMNPWQNESSSSEIAVECQGDVHQLKMNGRQATIGHIRDGVVTWF